MTQQTRRRPGAGAALLLLAAALAWPVAGHGANAQPTAAPAPAAEGAASEPAAAGKLSRDIPLRRDEASSDVAAPAAAVWPAMAGMLALGAVLVFWARRQRRMSGNTPPNGLPAGPLGQWLSSRGAGAAIRIVANQRLTPRHSVHVLQWQGREYFLGCGEQGLTVIDSRPVAAEAGGATPAHAEQESCAAR